MIVELLIVVVVCLTFLALAALAFHFPWEKLPLKRDEMEMQQLRNFAVDLGTKLDALTRIVRELQFNDDERLRQVSTLTRDMNDAREDFEAKIQLAKEERSAYVQMRNAR